jgi:hypothetical protein
VNAAERISDIEGKGATGSGERAGKRSKFQIRVWSLGGSFFHLGLGFPNLLHGRVVLLVKGECKVHFCCTSVAAFTA